MAEAETLQAVVTGLDELVADGRAILKIGLFNPDGTPWPNQITPEDGAFYTLSQILVAQQATIDDLVDRMTELEDAMEAYSTNQIKLLVGEEATPSGLRNGTLIGRLVTAP